MKGARKRGCFFTIGMIEEGEQFFVCEGFSTGASIHMATGKAVVVAFDCYNLTPVVESLKTQYSNTPIVICGDDDCYKDPNKNPGKENAEKAANMFGCIFVLPQFKDTKTKPTDFNDLHCLEGVEEVKNQLEEDAKPEDNWPEPEPIKCELLPVEPFDIRLLPEPLQDSVADIANRMQCPLDHIAIPSILMFASLIGAGCGIRPKKLDDWTIIPNLWSGIVGAPGTLKSPALEEALKPLNTLENKARKQYEADMESYLAKLKDYDLAKKNSQDIEKPLEPICRRFKTNDPTIEKLGELQKQNPKGLSLVRDELIGLLITWDKKGHESDRSFMLQAWNGYGSYTTDRIARGTVHCDNMCISIVGSTQPSKLSRYLQEAVNNTGNDGLMQRFQLLVYPDENSTWQYVDLAPNSEVQKCVFEIAEKVASGNPREYGAIIEEGCAAPYFHFCDDAQSFFIQWLTELESTKVRNSEDCSIIIEHLSKYRKLMPVLALIFHIIDIADGKTEPGPVTLDSAKRAAAWCDYLESHARRIYGTVLTQSKGLTLIVPPSAITLSEKIKFGKLKDEFTLRDVYRNGWSSIGKDPKIAKIACDFLDQIGWVRVKNNTSDKSQGGQTYQINPKIEISEHE